MIHSYNKLLRIIIGPSFLSYDISYIPLIISGYTVNVNPSHLVTYIQRSLKKRGENQAGSLFTILNCVDARMDECTGPLLECCVNAANWTSVFFTSLSGCRYPNEMG